MLYERLKDKRVYCCLCGHHCKIPESKYGFCGVRQNIDGRLYTLVYADVIVSHADPIEKKPFYHFLPGSFSYSIATIGCNFRCSFCQNWQISQVSKRNGNGLWGHRFEPQEVVREAKKNNCQSISYTFTEPTIFFEYAYDIAKLAHEEGLYNNFVTNGYMTEKALKTINPFLDACNVDLKFFRDETYKKMCQGHLEPVLNSIRTMKELGIWIEVTTLVVPGLNDSEEELRDIAGFIVSVGREVPWHISRFHPDYKFTDSVPTPLSTLKTAYRIGKKRGLRYVYIGNLPNEDQDTYCYQCGQPLVKRLQFSVIENRIRATRCPHCGADIDGIF